MPSATISATPRIITIIAAKVWALGFSPASHQASSAENIGLNARMNTRLAVEVL